MNINSLWSMEVDLRSREKEKRTLHWFVAGRQQPVFIKGLPDKVEFGVCFFYGVFLSYSYSTSFLFICLLRSPHSAVMIRLTLFV